MEAPLSPELIKIEKYLLDFASITENTDNPENNHTYKIVKYAEDQYKIKPNNYSDVISHHETLISKEDLPLCESYGITITVIYIFTEY